MTVSDPEWVSKISNNVERRAASLRQLSFLFFLQDISETILQNRCLICHRPPTNFRRYHGLHGSAGTVLTATTLSYGKWRNSTPRRIKTPSLVEMKLWTYDYVREICPQIYFCKNSCIGGFWRKWWNITSQFFFIHLPFFLGSPYKLHPLTDVRVL